jgi:diaminopimelate epimerase
MLTEYTKMNGLKNDFIVFLGPLDITSTEVAELCDRKTGIGADSVLVVTKTNKTIQMEYWNADGSLAEMCGNGLRCVARFAKDNNLTNLSEFVVTTPVGPLEVTCRDNENGQVEAQIGKVVIKPSSLSLEDLTFYQADVGNPHAITFVDSAEGAPVTTLGPLIENNEHFPNRTNVEFVEVIDDSNIRMRVWERGVGETLACGTGIVASVVLCAQEGKTTFPTRVYVQGGSATVRIDNQGFARLKGPVETAGTGTVEL